MTLEQYLAVLIDEGKKYVSQKLDRPESETLEQHEREELAMLILGHDIDTPAFSDFLAYFNDRYAANFFSELSSNTVYRHSDRDYDTALLDNLRWITSHYYEDNGRMQTLLTDYRAAQWVQRNTLTQQLRQQDLEGAVNE